MSESNRPLDEDGILLAREPEEEARPDDRIDDERMDEENTLKPEFVRSVEDALRYRDQRWWEGFKEGMRSFDPRNATGWRHSRTGCSFFGGFLIRPPPLSHGN